jgi:hypothetical protein
MLRHYFISIKGSVQELIHNLGAILGEWYGRFKNGIAGYSGLS